MEYEKKSVDLSNDSRSCVSNIGILVTCILAIVVGQGCTIKNIKDLDIGFSGLELETWEPSKYTVQGEFQSSTNGWFKK